MIDDKPDQVRTESTHSPIRVPRASSRRAALARLLVAVALLLLCVPAHAARRDRKADRTPASAEELYEQGLRAMQRGYYTRALEKFNRVRNYHRDDPLSVKAQLAIADVHFKKGDLAQARFAYEEFASYHPRHENLDYVTYRIGLSIYRDASRLAGRDQTATRSAVSAWTGFSSRFPESEYGEDVERLLQRSRDRLARKELFIARFYADREAWGAVRGRAEYLLRRYPDTEPAPEAMAWLGRSMHAWGDTQAALGIRERLAREHPESPYLARLDRWLARPPGERPDEAVFIRPYKVRGMQPGMMPGM